MMNVAKVTLLTAFCLLAGAAQAASTKSPEFGTLNNLHQVQDSGESYNVRPFLLAMTTYRRTAFTCEEYFDTSPVAGSEQIAIYFNNLGQEAPESQLPNLRRTLGLLVRSHAASICQEHLNRAYNTFVRRAEDYDENKPEEWPPAPLVAPGPWCSTVSCEELR